MKGNILWLNGANAMKVNILGLNDCRSLGLGPHFCVMTPRALALALGVAALSALRAPAGWNLCLEKWEKGDNQAYTLWAGGESLAAALKRLAWLVLAKWLALCRSPLQVTALGVAPSRAAVQLRVAVTWGVAAVPLLNAAGPHHITLCRCDGPAAAAAVAQRLQARGAPWLWEKGEMKQQLAREVSFCRTARRVEGMPHLIEALREGVLAEALAFEPDSRGLHVSL